jgi:hydrogenase-1 operon protein HyaF
MTAASPLTGPGSQPADDAFDYMEMPKGMRTFSRPDVPEPDETASLRPALARLEETLEALRFQAAGSGAPGERAARVELDGLDAANRAFVDQTLGDGEVSVIAGASLQAQESVFAGAWRLHEVDADGALISDAIEIGAFPPSVLRLAQDGAGPGLRPFDGEEPAGLMNAPALITEIAHKLARWRPGAAPEVLNFSLLPLSDADVGYLDARLGRGTVTILSRGYGNCRIASTAAKNAWQVRYYNSREILILNTLEITEIPSVACAAVQDLEDSASRLNEILELYR